MGVTVPHVNLPRLGRNTAIRPTTAYSTRVLAYIAAASRFGGCPASHHLWTHKINCYEMTKLNIEIMSDGYKYEKHVNLLVHIKKSGLPIQTKNCH